MRADAGKLAPMPASQIMAGVLHRERRGQRVRQAAIALVLLIGIGVVAYPRRGSDPAAGPLAQISDQEAIDQLRSEMARSLALADRLEALERAGRADRKVQRFEAGVAMQRERAATVLLNEARWRETRGESGVTEYRRTVELFDGTRAAEAARVALQRGLLRVPLRKDDV